MKKYLFFIVATAAIASLEAQAIVKVGSDTDVKVKGETLFYVGGDVDVANYTATDKKVLNEGNIRVTGVLKNANTDGGNFVNAASSGKYGQLIITGTNSNSGKITSQVKFNSKFNFQTIAIPYTGINAEDLVREAFVGGNPTFVNVSATGVYNENRYKNPIFFWNNETYTLDNLAANDNLNDPTAYYTLSTFAKALNGNFVGLSGVPYKDEVTVTVKGYVPGPKNQSINKYGEAYGSYIVDFTKVPGNWGNFYEESDEIDNTDNYGANIYYFGNPYTSNIDLSKGEGFLGNIIYQESSYEYNTDLTVAAVEEAVYSSAQVTTPEGAGDKLMSVRPLQTFAVKVPSLGVGSTHSFKFKNDMKTFTINSSANNVLYNKKQNYTTKINQVGLDLYDSEGNNTGNRTYVVASDIYEASQKGEGTEVYNITMSEDNTGIYTLQEAEDGSIDNNLSNSKAYINGVNSEKYVGKPIHLVFQNGKGAYTIKVRLNDELKKNKNSFYFEDKKNGKVIKLEDGSSINVNVEGTDADRFVLYWAKTPEAVVSKDLNEEVASESTVVYKDNQNNYKVRFDKSINYADIFVYNISGQLVNSVKGIKASNGDYLIPVKGNASVYIIKIVGDNDKVITKKIIK